MFFLVLRRTRTLHLVVESGVACSLLQFRRNGRSMEWQSNHLPSVYGGWRHRSNAWQGSYTTPLISRTRPLLYPTTPNIVCHEFSFPAIVAKSSLLHNGNACCILANDMALVTPCASDDPKVGCYLPSSNVATIPSSSRSQQPQLPEKANWFWMAWTGAKARQACHHSPLVNHQSHCTRICTVDKRQSVLVLTMPSRKERDQ